MNEVNNALTDLSPVSESIVNQTDSILEVEKKDENYIATFGESSPLNTSNKYPVAMAEKRAMSRAVLKLTGFYELGVFGEDESEEFKKQL